MLPVYCAVFNILVWMVVLTGRVCRCFDSPGMATEFGKTFKDMKEVECRRTPLQMKMDELGKQLSFLSFGIIAVIAIVGVLQVGYWTK